MPLKKIHNNLIKYKNNIAFCINEKFYTYNDFYKKISTIFHFLKEKKINKKDIVVVYTSNDIETYASIFAIWFLGATFVPINPNHPQERNNLILSQIKVKLFLSKQKTENLQINDGKILLPKTDKNDLMYILFTSGSTGIPKGVGITYENIEANFNNFLNTEIKIDHNDKFLQIYELTFDASIHSYLLPTLFGASVYTVPSGKIKYIEAYKIMFKHKITFAKLTPAILHYLKPYFKSIQLNSLRYNTLGGDSLNKNIILEWQKCVPNAKIYNFYGPTEATINTFYYKIDNQNTKNENNIIAIGKPFGDTKAIIIDKNNQIINTQKKGELCLAGKQISIGYINNSELNKTSFVNFWIDGKHKRFYKTGDLAYIDKDGDFIFCGRKDFQIQIQGYRVELQEIESQAKKIGEANNYIAVANKNKKGVNEIILFSENIQVKETQMIDLLDKKLPTYMMPSKIINLKNFPETSSGKIDRNYLKKLINE